MSLIASVEAYAKRKLTIAEIKNLTELQDSYKINDDDPLMILIDIMTRTQIIADTLPDLLHKKAIETMELHRSNMRDQSVLMSKELIATIAEQIKAANLNLNSNLNLKKISWKAGWIRYVGCVVAGMFLYAMILRMSRSFDFILWIKQFVAQL
jgi:hypothetical protein